MSSFIAREEEHKQNQTTDTCTHIAADQLTAEASRLPAQSPVTVCGMSFGLREQQGTHSTMQANTHTQRTHANILAPVLCPAAPALSGSCSARTHPAHTRLRPHSRASLDTVVRFLLCMICKSVCEESRPLHPPPFSFILRLCIFFSSRSPAGPEIRMQRRSAASLICQGQPLSRTIHSDAGCGSALHECLRPKRT